MRIDMSETSETSQYLKFLAAGNHAEVYLDGNNITDTAVIIADEELGYVERYTAEYLKSSRANPLPDDSPNTEKVFGEVSIKFVKPIHDDENSQNIRLMIDEIIDADRIV